MQPGELGQIGGPDEMKRGSGKGLIFSVPGIIRRCRKGLECLAGSGLQLLGVHLIVEKGFIQIKIQFLINYFISNF